MLSIEFLLKSTWQTHMQQSWEQRVLQLYRKWNKQQNMHMKKIWADNHENFQARQSESILIDSAVVMMKFIARVHPVNNNNNNNNKQICIAP